MGSEILTLASPRSWSKDSIRNQTGTSRPGWRDRDVTCLPEVVRCLPYGFSADVHCLYSRVASYCSSGLLWLIMMPICTLIELLSLRRSIALDCMCFAQVTPANGGRLLVGGSFREAEICIQIQSEPLEWREERATAVSLIDRLISDRSPDRLLNWSEWK
jgi:hypothetical protein